jgi:hypothetical protein
MSNIHWQCRQSNSKSGTDQKDDYDEQRENGRLAGDSKWVTNLHESYNIGKGTGLAVQHRKP